MLTLQHACRILRRNNRRKQATLISKLRKAVRFPAYLSLRMYSLCSCVRLASFVLLQAVLIPAYCSLPIYSVCSCGFIRIRYRRYAPKLGLPARYLSARDVRERCNCEVFRSLRLRRKTFGEWEFLSGSSCVGFPAWKFHSS